MPPQFEQIPSTNEQASPAAPEGQPAKQKRSFLERISGGKWGKKLESKPQVPPGETNAEQAKRLGIELPPPTGRPYGGIDSVYGQGAGRATLLNPEHPAEQGREKPAQQFPWSQSAIEGSGAGQRINLEPVPRPTTAEQDYNEFNPNPQPVGGGRMEPYMRGNPNFAPTAPLEKVHQVPLGNESPVQPENATIHPTMRKVDVEEPLTAQEAAGFKERKPLAGENDTPESGILNPAHRQDKGELTREEYHGQPAKPVELAPAISEEGKENMMLRPEMRTDKGPLTQEEYYGRSSKATNLTQPQGENPISPQGTSPDSTVQETDAPHQEHQAEEKAA